MESRKRNRVNDIQRLRKLLEENPPEKSKAQIKVKKSVKNHTKYSTFMLTINTNRGGNEAKEELEEAVDLLIPESGDGESLYQGEDLSRWITFLQGDEYDIKDFEVNKGEIEFMSKNGSAHIHITVSIVHEAKLQLNHAKIKEEFANELGYDPYVNIHLLKDYRGSARDYTSKTAKTAKNSK